MSNDEYGADSIQSLEGLEAVKKRPGMYIGSTDDRGLHHLVYEVVDNSIDEAMAGYCDTISISINEDNSVTVTDNGRGIPVDKKDGEEKAALELILTTLHAGGKFDNDAYKVSGGLHGVGVSVVNALSEWLEVEVIREGKVWTQRYEEGDPVTEIEAVEDLDESDPAYETGTSITFKPSLDTFETDQFDYKTLQNRVQELAFLNPGIEIQISDARPEDEDLHNMYRYDGGIKEYVEYLNEVREPIHEEIIYFEGEEDNRVVEVAMQFTTDVQESIHSFANNIPTREGGTHITGFKTSLTRIINSYAEDNGMVENVESLKGADIREGLTAVISVKHPDPQFEGQTKTKLGNSEMRGITSGVMHDELEAYMEQNPDIAQHIVRKAVEAAKARQAADKAKEVARRDTPLATTSLPGKLADCQTREAKDSELFIVEGDSAGGCFTGDTEVQLASGETKTFEQLVEEQDDYQCYTVLDDGTVGTEDIANPRVTKEDAELMAVELDNDEVIECTPDHEFMLQSGEYTEAQNLDVGDSLMTNIEGEVTVSEPVQYLEKTEDVYDIEVPGTHNFALASGVFVHNSAKQARDRETQAVLPLKGKILNVEKHRLDRILENEQIQDIVKAIGAGVGDEFSVDETRYDSIVIFTDADVDGAHIRTLLLTLFYRHMKPLLEEGKVYAAKPPLYRLRYGGTVVDVMSDEERDQVIADKGQPDNVQRFKGLGEMNPDQLWETTMNPENRVLKQITINDAAAADKLFTILMGSDVAPRKKFITENATEAEWVDI